MRSLQSGAVAALLGALLTILGCGRADTGGSKPTAVATLEQASALAAALPEMAARLAPTEMGFVREGESAKSIAAKNAGDLYVNLPARADGQMTTSAGPWQVAWQLEGATASGLEVDEGRAVYRDAYPATDVVITAEPSRVETFFVLRDPSAPSEFSWKVSLPSGLEAKGEADGGIAFADRTGSKRLRVGAAKAVDAEGAERAAVLSFEEGTLKVSLDTVGLVYPVLLDPPVETVVWTNMSPASRPPARRNHSLAYDSARGKVVLFGGEGSSGYLNYTLNDTWEWDGTNWVSRGPASSPPARHYHSLAYDSARGKVVLFGGYGSSGYLNDTWEWDGTNWISRSSASRPTARAYHSLAYDSARKKVVLFSGQGSSGPLRDTLEWDGTSWSSRGLASIPPARQGHSLAYDSARKEVVLFGGQGSSGLLNDTWEWDETNWVSRSPASIPPARVFHSLAYDSARGKVVLFGGTSGTYLNDTWEYHAFGGGCSSDDQCNTGYCVDSVCCESACGGGDPNDCMACSVAAGASMDGICSPVANDTTCDDGDATTLEDKCTAGTCAGVNRCAGVICQAKDQCHDAGTCDPATGVCSDPLKANGSSCDDGNLCTQSDTCQSGTCVGTNPVTCTASDQCHDAGTCDPATGVCSDPPKANGSSCDDGNACTQSDSCQSGTCVGSNPVTCAASDQCHDAGTCNPVTGVCSDPPKVNGSACDDDNACTEADTCQAGECVGGPPVTCRNAEACEDALGCDPAQGCVFAPKPPSTLCRAAACEAGQALSEGRCDGTNVTCPSAVAEDCGHFTCASGACLSSCATSDDCISSAFCDEGLCQAKQPQGQACKDDEGCTDGLCVDDFCCDTTCTGQCEACDVVGSEGTCAPVTGAPHGDRTECAGQGTSCGGACDGEERDRCAYPTDTCRSGSCDASSNTATLEASCDGQGSCPVVQTQSCAPFLCDAQLCAGNCAHDDECTAGHYCAAGICVVKLAQGEGCAGDNQCATGNCIDGVCCDTACDGQCEACDIAGSVGTCSLVPSGAPHGGRPACAGQGTCQGVCDGTNATACAYPGSDTACGEASCANGKETRAPACDGEGACGSSKEAECDLYACGASECLTTCTSHEDCANGASCVGASCVIDDGDAGVDGGDDLDAGEEAGADAEPDDGDDADGGSKSDAGMREPFADAEEGSCACRAVGGTSQSGPAAWLGLGLAVAVWRRGRSSQLRDARAATPNRTAPR